MTLLSLKLIDNVTYIKTNAQDFDVSLQKVSNIQSQFFWCKLRLLTAKTKPNLLELINFYLIYNANKYSNKQILYCHVAAKLTMVPKEKGDFCNKKIIKIELFVQKLL